MEAHSAYMGVSCKLLKTTDINTFCNLIAKSLFHSVISENFILAFSSYRLEMFADEKPAANIMYALCASLRI